MIVAELIEKFKEFPQDKEVKITDGYKDHFYEGDFPLQLFKGVNGSTCVNICIGGFEVEE